MKITKTPRKKTRTPFKNLNLCNASKPRTSMMRCANRNSFSYKLMCDLWLVSLSPPLLSLSLFPHAMAAANNVHRHEAPDPHDRHRSRQVFSGQSGCLQPSTVRSSSAAAATSQRRWKFCQSRPLRTVSCFQWCRRPGAVFPATASVPEWSLLLQPWDDPRSTRRQLLLVLLSADASGLQRNQISPQVYHNVDPNASFVSSNGDSTRTSTPMMIMGNVIPQDDIWKQWAVQQTTANSTPPEWKWMTCRCGRNSTDTPMR
ncbi:hypothetical protein L596_020823 [Steinernema carpocapsae]|uniref:Uncharacterized protein n=1 Tax=Steinernema carpocapsae TaxID=34508 RepID=A0A4U5MVF3_STECR|nr:hypothetical protein L596_020823 [Steinernema carpocapsae]